ncbi:MAG: L,D-transpeptidase, partial [Verrucomicrobiales bacterium]|nr:L,D-transpeptidase [Verrucomicrobiales bacterium]
MITRRMHLSPGRHLSQITRPGLLLALSALALATSSCTSSKPADVVVSIQDQKLGIYGPDGKLNRAYRISTSKFGLGDKPGSNCTPIGTHEIVAKIGHGLPPGAVLKSRRWNGEVLRPNAPGRDPIVSRILWLKGLETKNRHAFGRYIYIHGTPEEARLGQPASYGCVRMGMKDVIDLFDTLPIGSHVEITPNKLPRGTMAANRHQPPAARPVPMPAPMLVSTPQAPPPPAPPSPTPQVAAVAHPVGP